MMEGDVSKQRNRELMTVVEAYAGGELSRRDLVRKLGVLGGGALFGGPLAARFMAESAAAAGTSTSTYASTRFRMIRRPSGVAPWWRRRSTSR